MTLADVPVPVRPNVIYSIKTLLTQLPPADNPSVWLIQSQFEACAGDVDAEWEVILNLPITIIQENPFTPPQLHLDLRPLPQED